MINQAWQRGLRRTACLFSGRERRRYSVSWVGPLVETEMQVDRARVWEDTRAIYHPKPHAWLDLLSSCFFKS